MANTASSSTYEKLTITKDGKEVNLAEKTVEFNYFESLLSPNVTATLSFVDSGFSESKDEKRNAEGSIYNIPLTGQLQVVKK